MCVCVCEATTTERHHACICHTHIRQPSPRPFHFISHTHTHTHTLSLSLSLSLLTSLLSFLPKPTEAISSSLQAMSTSAKPSGAVVRHTNAAVFFQSLFSRISGEVVASCADFLCPPVDGSDKPLFWNVDLDEEQREHMPRWLREGVCVCVSVLACHFHCLHLPPPTHTHHPPVFSSSNTSLGPPCLAAYLFPTTTRLQTTARLTSASPRGCWTTCDSARECFISTLKRLSQCFSGALASKHASGWFSPLPPRLLPTYTRTHARMLFLTQL